MEEGSNAPDNYDHIPLSELCLNRNRERHDRNITETGTPGDIHDN